MTEWRPVVGYEILTKALGRWRGLFLPLGIAALVALGVHSASELVVSWAFHVLGAIDLASEWVVEGLLAAPVAVGLADLEWVARNAYAFASLFGVEDREAAARYGGLAVELYVDLYLVWAALGYVEPRAKPSRLRAMHWRSWREHARERGRQLWLDARYYVADLTVEKVYLPLGALFAVISGTRAVGLAAENALFASLADSRLLSAPALVPWFVAALHVALALRLGWPMVDHALDRAESRNEDARLAWVPTRRRQLRGLVPALIVLTVLGASMLASSPFGSWAGAS